MRFDKTILLIAFLALWATASAQTGTKGKLFGRYLDQTPRLEAGVGYMYLHANAPPDQCGCFSANGGYGSAVVNLPHGVAIVADFAAAHADTIGATTQSITVFNYLFGPRYSFRPAFKRFVPYAQVLGGGSEEFSSYAAVHNIRGAAFSAGGGFSTTLKQHLGWTLLEADWVHSYLSNGQNNMQNDLRISTGVTFRFWLH